MGRLRQVFALATLANTMFTQLLPLTARCYYLRS